MDLSNLGVEDLKALQNRDYDSMSAEGLQELQKQRQQAKQTAALAANPPLQPDSADKAATAKAPSAVSLAPKGAARQDLDDMESMPQGIKNGFVRAAIGTGVGMAGGEMAAGAGLLSRAAVNAGASGLQQYLGNLATGSKDPTEGVLPATAMGGAFSVGADAVGGALGGLKRMYQTVKGAANPAGLQDEAIGAVADATDKLRQSEAQNVTSQLKGKTLAIDTTRIRGINPEIDQILSDNAKTPYGDIPSEMIVPAEDANRIRQLIDSEMTHKKLGPYAQTAETAERDARLKPLADYLRGQVHDLSPELSDTFDQWSDNLNAARNLDKRAETAPMTVLTSPSIDRRALLQKVDEQAGTSLQELGSRINDSKNLSNAVHQIQPLKALGTLGLSGVKGTYNAAQDGSVLSDPRVLQSLFGTASGVNGN